MVSSWKLFSDFNCTGRLCLIWRIQCCCVLFLHIDLTYYLVLDSDHRWICPHERYHFEPRKWSSEHVAKIAMPSVKGECVYPLIFYMVYFVSPKALYFFDRKPTMKVTDFASFMFEQETPPTVSGYNYNLNI
jgi:hypothetical protein